MKGFKEFLEWENLSRFLKENAFKIVIMIVIFKIAKYAKKHIDKVIRIILDKSRIDKSVASFLMSLYSILYYIVLTYVLIDILGINTSSITTFFSAAGIVLGIAFKETIGNFGGGLIILTFKPFKVGDMIEYNKYVGEVKSIEMFYTKMKTPQNELVIIPNGIITNTELRNMTNEKVRRLDMIIGVSYNSDIKKVKEVLNDIVKENIFRKDQRSVEGNNEKEHYILPVPEPTIGVVELGESSVNFNIFVYTKSENYFNLKLKLNEEIKIRFDAENIEIPYPQMDIHINKQVKDREIYSK